MVLIDAPLWLHYALGLTLFGLPLLYTLLNIEKFDPATGTWRPLILLRRGQKMASA